MKASEITKGGKYIAKVSGVLTTVRVDEIREVNRFGGTGYDGRTKWVDRVVYDVTNLKTGRRTTFRSAAKFRRAVAEKSSALESKLRNLADAGRRGSITPEEQDAQHTAILIAEVNSRQGREMEEAIGPVPETLAEHGAEDAIIDEDEMNRLGEQIDAEFGPINMEDYS